MKLISDKNIFNSKKPPNPKIIFEILEEIASEYCQHTKENSAMRLTSVHDYERSSLLEKISNLSIDNQKKRLDESIQRYENVRNIYKTGTIFYQKKRSLNAFLRLHRLRMPNDSEVFQLINNETLIEIYNLHSSQVYRSLDFMDFVSHSIMSLEVSEWWELFSRSEKILSRIYGLALDIYSGKVEEPIFNPVGLHTVKEINSRTPLCAQLLPLVYAPLFTQNGKVEGALHLFKIESLQSLNFKVISTKNTSKSLS